MPSAAEKPLLDAGELRQLEALGLAGREAIFAGFGGQRPGTGRSRGLDFVDYRRYTPGDDLRSIDWNVYARLRELVVKASPSEGHVDLAILLDGSASMGVGRDSSFRYGQEVAAMLGTVALLGSDVVEIDLLADGRARTGARLTAPHLVSELVAEVGRLPRGERTDLLASIRSRRRAGTGADLAVLVSDGLVPSDELAAALHELATAASSACLVHLLTAAADPGSTGPVELVDSESGERAIVDLGPAARASAAERRKEMARAAAAAAAAVGVAYVRAAAATAPIDLLFGAARDAGLVTV